MTHFSNLSIQVRKFSAGGYYALPKIGFDLLLWVGLVLLARHLNFWPVTGLAIFLIGSICMHDLLVHGHDGTHGLISRSKPFNEFFTWFNHALVGISGTAYRAFHLDHHRYAHTAQDPEYRLIHKISGGQGWGYLLLPLFSHVVVNFYPFLSPKSAAIRWRVGLDFLGMVLLHILLIVVLSKGYLWFVLIPIFTSLAAVVVIRSICEHHFANPPNHWTKTRAMKAPRWLEWLWSNTNYHLEHHLFPTVPFHQMPALRQLIQPQFSQRKVILDEGYLKTAWILLRTPHHFRPTGESL